MGYRDRKGDPLSDVQWYELFRDREYQQLASTYSEDGVVHVSTIWIGASHSMFESMVFLFDATGEDDIMERYSTEVEAIAGHAQLVAEYIIRPALKDELETAGGHSVLLDGAL